MKNFFTISTLLCMTFILWFNKSFAQSGWVSQTSGKTQDLLNVFFTDADSGTAVGGNFFGAADGTILRTTNGGTTCELYF